MPYDPKTIEPRWQSYWIENETFKATLDPSRPKFYVLDMFPYPSSEGLHVGHPKGYISTDAISRYKRMRGLRTSTTTGASSGAWGSATTGPARSTPPIPST